MTFSTSAAMTLRRVNSGFWKILRISRSVSRCWMSISSTCASDKLGVERCAAEGDEFGKGLFESWVFLVRFRRCVHGATGRDPGCGS